MFSVRIVDCGVPPLGFHREYGVKTPNGIYFKSQVYPDPNCHDAARREAKQYGLDHYFDEKGYKV